MLFEDRGAAIEGLPVNRLALVKAHAHVGPLTSLAREKERNRTPAADIDPRRCGGSCSQFELLDRVGSILHHNGPAVFERATADAKRPGDIVHG